MRYRSLDANGDFVFGRGRSEFLVDTPETVAQAVETRLRLLEGEWFLDVTAGTPYFQQILGAGTLGLYDQAIKERIIDTPGVISIDSYSSALDSSARALTVSATISTQFGVATFTTTLAR